MEEGISEICPYPWENPGYAPVAYSSWKKLYFVRKVYKPSKVTASSSVRCSS